MAFEKLNSLFPETSVQLPEKSTDLALIFLTVLVNDQSK